MFGDFVTLIIVCDMSLNVIKTTRDYFFVNLEIFCANKKKMCVAYTQIGFKGFYF